MILQAHLGLENGSKDPGNSGVSGSIRRRSGAGSSGGPLAAICGKDRIETGFLEISNLTLVSGIGHTLLPITIDLGLLGRPSIVFSGVSLDHGGVLIKHIRCGGYGGRRSAGAPIRVGTSCDVLRDFLCGTRHEIHNLSNCKN